MKFLSLGKEVSKKPFTSRHSWRPFTLGRLYLLGLVIVTFIAIVSIEIVVQTSGPGYSLAFQPREGTDDFSKGADFVTLYLPTIVAVLYSVAWIWVHIDYISGALVNGSANVDRSPHTTPNASSLSFRCLRSMARLQASLLTSTIQI